MVLQWMILIRRFVSGGVCCVAFDGAVYRSFIHSVCWSISANLRRDEKEQPDGREIQKHPRHRIKRNLITTPQQIRFPQNISSVNPSLIRMVTYQHRH